MKKFLIIIAIIILIGGGYFGYNFITNKNEEKRIAEIKKGWYVEVLTKEIRIRKEPNRNSAELTIANKGDVFAVDDMTGKNNNFWYHIEYDDGKYGWIANPKNTNYLNDENNPSDIASPTIKFFEPVYYVDTIDDINYKHLEITDDRDGVEVTHEVYHEVDASQGKNQYWILYKAVDKAGKSSQKLQKIEFNKRPDESRVLDFATLER